MLHLDELESQSVFILREAYSQIEPLAMLWSLGKDSNVMVWLARKAFCGHVPFPVAHVDTGKKFKEMYEFRDRYAVEWNLNLLTGDCPPIESIDPSLPPAARSAARKTEGLKAMIETHGFRGVIAGHKRANRSQVNDLMDRRLLFHHQAESFFRLAELTIVKTSLMTIEENGATIMHTVE